MEIAGDLPLSKLPAAAREADLYLLTDHSEAHDIPDSINSGIQRQIAGKDGYEAKLRCFSGLPSPQDVFLTFDSPGAPPPLTGSGSETAPVIPGKAAGLAAFGDNFLFFGLESQSPVQPALPRRGGADFKAGVWLMPVPQLDVAIAPQKQTQLAQMALATAALEHSRQDLLANYDHNHNGILDPDKRKRLWMIPLLSNPNWTRLTPITMAG